MLMGHFISFLIWITMVFGQVESFQEAIEFGSDCNCMAEINNTKQEVEKEIEDLKQQNNDLQDQFNTLQEQLAKLLESNKGYEACFEDLGSANCTGSQSGKVGIVEAIRVDGEWGPFSEWSQCSVTCGGGVKLRNRTCNNPSPHNGGKPCSGDGVQQEGCNADKCYVPECTGSYEFDVEYSRNDIRSCGRNKKPTASACQEFCKSVPGCVGWEWGYAGDNCCAKSKMANRKSGKSGRVAGLKNACPPALGLDREIRVDGGWGPFSEWSQCSVTCGGGVQFRNRTCNNPSPHNGGKPCSGDGVQQEGCNADKCYECPEEKGFCVLPNGGDQNLGVIKLDEVDGNTPEKKETCLSKCSAYPGATGCEVIWNHGNRGCYVHTQEVERGNGVNNHACWIFSKCPGTKEDIEFPVDKQDRMVVLMVGGRNDLSRHPLKSIEIVTEHGGCSNHDIPPLPEGRWGGAVGVVVHTQESENGTLKQIEVLMFCGGVFKTREKKDCWTLDFSLMEWNTAPSLLHATVFPAYTSVKERFYVVGGLSLHSVQRYGNIALDHLQIYSEGKWQLGKPLPSKRYGACCKAYLNYLVVAGGWDKEQAWDIVKQKEVFVYSERSRKWRNLTTPDSYIGRATHSCATITYKNTSAIALVGGLSKQLNRTFTRPWRIDMLLLNKTGVSWDHEDMEPVGAYKPAVGVSPGGELVVAGGTNSDTYYSFQVMRWSPGRTSWEHLGNLTTPRVEAAVLNLDLKWAWLAKRCRINLDGNTRNFVRVSGPLNTVVKGILNYYKQSVGFGLRVTVQNISEHVLYKISRS